MERTGVFNHVNLLNMTNEKAEEKIKDIKIRFLFIDGDHTEKGVEKDINLFFPKLLSGSIIVFDDFSNNFPGLIKTIDKLLFDKKFSRIMTYNNTLVLVIWEKKLHYLRKYFTQFDWGPDQIRTGVEAFAELCLAARPQDH